MNAHYEHAHPRYGFEFGAARVTRVTHIEGRFHVIGLDTPFRHVQISVSPTGRSVRVWVDGTALVPFGEDGTTLAPFEAAA